MRCVGVLKKISRKEMLQVSTITLMALVAPVTIKVLESNLSVNGSAYMYLNEIIVILLGVYVILYQGLFKGKIKEFSKLTMFNLLIGVLFGVLYIATLLLRYKMGTLTFGSFFLARLIVQATIIIVLVDYFKINKKVLIFSYISIYVLTTIWQYGILFFGSGALRGTDPVLTISYVYAIFVNSVHALLAILYYRSRSIRNRRIILGLYLINLPTLLLTGSRVGLMISLFVIVVVILSKALDMTKPEHPVKFFLKDTISIVLLSFAMLIFTVLLSSNINKSVTVRSISVPVKIVKKITPKEFGNKLDELLTFDVDQDDIGDITSENSIENSNDYLNETSEVSSSHRKEANGKAYELIFSSPFNLILGTGTGIIHRYGDVYQKPHNFFAQYALAFGLMGFVMTLLLYFSGVLNIYKNGFKEDKLLVTVLILPMVINSFLQPSFGNIFALFTFILTVYSINHSVSSRQEHF